MDNAAKQSHDMRPNTKSATPGQRLFGFGLDVIFVFIIWTLISMLLSIWMTTVSEAPPDLNPNETRNFIVENEPYLQNISLIIELAVVLIYFLLIPLIVKTRQTPGMMIGGMKFYDQEQEIISRSKYVGRELLKWVLFPGFFLVFNKERRSLADKMTGTYVLTKNEQDEIPLK